MVYRAALAMTFMLIVPIGAQGQEVSVHDGNLFLSDAAGEQRQLTSSGRDGQPDLSPDKRWIVFVRRLLGPKISGPTGDVDPNEIWIIGADGQQARQLVGSEGCEPHEGCPLSGLGRPQFADDGNGIFFETQCAAVTGCIWHLDLKTKLRKEIGGGSFLHVIHEGRLRGNLLVIKHKYFMCGGSYDWWWVIKPDGSELGALGDANARSEEEALDFCL